MIKKNILKKFSWALLGRLIAAAIQALAIVLLARWESLENFGLVIPILTLAVLIHAIIDFGLSPYIIKERAKTKNDSIIYECAPLNIYIVNIFSVIAIIFLLNLGFFVDNIYYYLLPLSVWINFERRADFLLGIFIADGKNKEATQLLVARRFVFFILFILLHLIFNLEVTLSYSIGIAIAAILSYIQIQKKLHLEKIVASKKNLHNIFIKTLPFWINSLFSQLRNIDVVILTILLGSIQGAYFGFVNRLISPLNMISTSMSVVVLPSVSKKEIKEKEFIKYIFLITLFSSIPYFLLYIYADSIIMTFVGEKYIPTIPLIQVLCIGLVFFSASSILSSILQGINLQKKVAYANMLSTIMYFILLVVFLLYTSNILYGVYTLVCFFVLRFLFMLVILLKHFAKENNEKH